MVNLRGALRGLGTGLTFLGQQGMAEQQRVAADRRLLDREAAFARIQQGIRREDQDEDVKRDIVRAEAETPVLAERERSLLTVREPYRVAEDERTAARTERSADRADERAERRESRADSRAAAREEAAERRQAASRGDEIVDRFTNDQGHRVLVTRTGEEITLTSRVRSDDDYGDEDDPPAATPRRSSAPAARAAPAARRTNERPPFPGARRGADGKWYLTRRGQHFLVEP